MFGDSTRAVSPWADWRFTKTDSALAKLQLVCGF
jgi:hypothetical protein